MYLQTSISAVGAIIGYTFENQELLWSAWHAAGSPFGGADGNKTMAMLGDAVLNVVLLDDLIPAGSSRGKSSKIQP